MKVPDDLPPDAPVSNRDLGAPTAPSFKSIIEVSNTGSAQGVAAPEAGGTEAVPGFSPRTKLGIEDWRPDTSRPVDVAWATYGPPPPMPEAVVGPDERVRVPDPSIFPWRLNASLQIAAPDGQLYVGTGWFIGPYTLVTAGHCVFIHDANGRYKDWARAIRVMPGRNATSLPFGAVVSTTFHTVAGWARDRDPRFDYAALVLPTDLGNTVGWLGLGVFDDAHLVNRVANISGYPGDKVGAEDGTQWYDAKALTSVDEYQLHYQVDTWGGQSGSAAVVVEGQDRLAVGIHAYGDSYFGNSATRITPSVHANLLKWRK